MNYESISLNNKFSLFKELWTPKVIAKLDNYLLKIVKIQGHFSWHKHDECDEIFIVFKGKMRIDFRDGFVELNEGELFVVPKGKEHKPFAEEICEVYLLERDDVINTGNVKDEFTKEILEWI